MPFDPTISFAADISTTVAVGALLTGIAAAAGTALMVPAVTRRILPSPKETHLADFLPFESLQGDGRTTLLKNGQFARYFVIGGIDQTFMNQDENLAVARHRKNFLDGLAEINVTARVFTIRRPLDVASDEGFPNHVAKEVAGRWNKQFEKSYRTINIIGLSGKTEQKLTEGEQVLESTLAPYDVYHLTQDSGKTPEKMTLGSFLGSLASPASSPAPTGTGMNFSDALAGDIVWFRPDGVIEFTSPGRKKYGVAIGLKRLGDDMNSTMSTEIASLSMEMTISRYIEPMSKGEAIIRLEQHSRLAVASSLNPNNEH